MIAKVKILTHYFKLLTWLSLQTLKNLQKNIIIFLFN